MHVRSQVVVVPEIDKITSAVMKLLQNRSEWCNCVVWCQVGQYLMTLPQQLEPFTMTDNPMLTVAVKHGKLPYAS